MAKRGWEEGWLNQFAWARPISDLIQEEQVAARARQLEEEERTRALEENERTRARQQAIEARTQMGHLLALERSSLLRFGGVVSHLTVAAMTLAESISRQIHEDVQKQTISHTSGIALLGRVTLMVERLTRASHQYLQTEHLEVGDPTEIVGLKTADALPDNLSLEEAEIRAKAALQALGSVRRGHLTLIEGGAAGATGETWAGEEPSAV